MGGPGVIMTSKIVTGVAPGLKDCLKVTVTGHEDTELGRCITINTGVQCTIAFQVGATLSTTMGRDTFI